MIWFWIMDACLNIALFKELLEFVAPFGTNHVHVINRRGPLSFARGLNDAIKALLVTRRNSPAVRVEPVKMFEHHAADGSVDLIKPHIVTRKFMIVLSLAAVVSQHPKPF